MAKLDRLSRSVVDGGRLFERAKQRSWFIVAPDVSVDTSTANGRLMANLMMTLGQWESDIVSERTRDALAAKKAAGVHVGRHAELPEDVARQIRRWSARGWGASRIARALNERGVPTARGGDTWYPSVVQYVLDRTRQRAPRSRASA